MERGQRWRGRSVVATTPRLLHEATADFGPPIDASWQRNWLRDLGGDDVVYGHCDTGPWNIVGRGGWPEAFIDWEFAGPVARSWELAETIWLNAQLHDDDIAERHGLPDAVGRARQVRAVLDGYGVSRTDRPMVVDRLAEVAIHGARADAVAAEVMPESTAAVDDEGYPVLWSIAWRARSASWIVRHRDLLRRHACQMS